MKTKATILSALLLVLAFATQAQQTGSFNTPVSFNGQNRNLSCYVPSSYDPTQEYRLMIALHGMGDNSNNYRNALINSLDWGNVFPNTIFICPDAGPDQNKDFYTPAGDETIIDTAIAFAMENYSIDSSYVVLQGFSLGGRSAAKYGLEHPSMFKGLLLNTPAFQGSKDIRNDTIASLGFNYSNASQIPIFITVGERDQIYYYQLENLVLDTLKKNDGIISYHPIPGMPHTVPGSNITSQAYPFFENPEGAAFDVDLFGIEMPQHTCEANISPSFFVQNRGTNSISSLDVGYQLGGNSGTHTWTGTLDAFEHTKITLPAMTTTDGEHSLELSIGTINGNQTDTVTENNTFYDTVQVSLEGATPQITEDFEGSSQGWIFTETGSLFEWYRDTDVKQAGAASVGNFNTILLFYTMGNVESFQSPVVDLSLANTTELTFDVAYNYHKYTPPYFLSDTAFTDTLEVAISTDCGQSWQSLYKRGGEELATADDPLLNPLTLQACFFDPDSSEWRNDTIDLGAFANETGAIIRFNYISANGGSINIDNIVINGVGIGMEELAVQGPEVYPNPADDYINISADGAKISEVQIFDISGNLVFDRQVPNGSSEVWNLETANIPSGIYQVQIKAEGKTHTKKLLIHR